MIHECSARSRIPDRPHLAPPTETLMQRVNRPYVGIPTFLRAKLVEDIATLDAAIAVLGVPFDEGSPFLPGSRLGPRALREQSLRFAGRNGIYDVNERKEYLKEEMEGG